MFYQKLRSLFVGALLLTMLGTTACSLPGSGDDCTESQFSGLRPTIPASATNVSESCSGGFNPTVRAEFTMPAGDLATFQGTTSIENWQTNTADGAVSFADEAAQRSSYIFGRFGNGAITQEVLIDTADAQQYKVYYSSTNVD